jgi:hypothetical protein
MRSNTVIQQIFRNAVAALAVFWGISQIHAQSVSISLAGAPISSTIYPGQTYSIT